MNVSASYGTDRTARANSFDGLRLLGALAVIWGHGYGLRGDWNGAPTVAGYEVQSLGVILFFSISGYLITASWRRRPNLNAYLLARCLRIFPALAVVVLATLLVIGPAVTGLSLGDYAQRRDTWTYLGNVVLRFQQSLPGVWEDLPNPWVNGSLWTLPIEFACYLLVPAAMILTARLRPTAVVLATTSAVLATFLVVDGQSVWNTQLHEVATMGLFFLAGALLRVWHERGHQFHVGIAAGLVVTHLVLLQLIPGAQWHFGWVTIPYVVLWIGTKDLPGFRDAARLGDVSYGLYLWGYPVQQLVVDKLGILPTGANLALVLLLTCTLALASWYLVEKPALALKGRLGRRTSSGAGMRV